MMTLVEVDWFDAPSGLGEGRTTEGKRVYLDARRIANHPITFEIQVGQTLVCELKKATASSFIATKIEIVEGMNMDRYGLITQIIDNVSEWPQSRLLEYVKQSMYDYLKVLSKEQLQDELDTIKRGEV